MSFSHIYSITTNCLGCVTTVLPQDFHRLSWYRGYRGFRAFLFINTVQQFNFKSIHKILPVVAGVVANDSTDCRIFLLAVNFTPYYFFFLHFTILHFIS